MGKHAVATSDLEIDAALDRAKRNSPEVLARSVEYVPELKLVIISLSNQRRLVLPLEDLQGLEHATPEQMQNYELVGSGTGLSFPVLGAEFYVPALLEGVYGTRRWMAQLGQRGGSVKSAAKSQAARENGSRGGRPKKVSVPA